jgi:S-methylmethionine-dependent homocysteine/selenocysteine methylase
VTPVRLPQLEGELLITDSGLETELVFHDGIELPEFAAFVLLRTEEGTARLRRYYERFAALAAEHGVGLLLESPTWRANPAWAALIGIPAAELDALNRQAIALMHEVQRASAGSIGTIVVSGCVGPESDGYRPESLLSPDEAFSYHRRQIDVFAESGAAMVAAITMTYAEEAMGIVRAARAAGLPVAISFTLETDGRLPSGEALGDAIERVDRETDGGPDYYMLNCAHPVHFAHVLTSGAPWLERIRGLRANASPPPSSTTAIRSISPAAIASWPSSCHSA